MASGAGMTVSDFMVKLADKLKEERHIADSTANQYLQTLYKLNDSKPFNNLAWAKKYDEVQKIIDTYAESTRGNQYMVLTSALSPFNDKATYKKAYEYWRDKMMEARKERDALPKHIKSEKEDESWLTWEEVQKKKSELSEDISSFAGTKHITALQFLKLLQFVVLSLYTDIPPRRNEYTEMYVVKKWNKDMDTTKNYYDLSTHKFIFNKYKTAKTYGQQIVDVPDSLQSTLSVYLKFHPLAKSKAKEFKLLVKPDGSNLNETNSITRILNKLFKRKVGSSLLRHIYLSHKFGDVNKEMEETAESMSHSVAEQKNYIRYD